MNVPIKIPKHGLNMTKGLLTDILVKLGDHVDVGDILFQVESDKAVLDVESEHKGVVAEITANIGEEFPVGTVVVMLDTGDKSALAEPKTVKAESQHPVLTKKPDKILATPVARKYARENSVDLALIRPKSNVIEKEDIERYMKERNGTVPSLIAPFEYSTEGKQKAERSKIKKLTAERLAYSFREIPHFYLVRDVTLRSFEEERQTAMQQGRKIGIGDLLLAASAKALSMYPLANASYYDGEIWYNPSVNVGYAVASPKGLLVPVLHEADKLRLDEISEKRRELVKKALDGKLGPEELEGGTFTITNLATFNIDRFFAIINPPQAAILSVGRIKQVPAASSSSVKTDSVLSISLAVDHRVLDGSEAAGFLAAIADMLERETVSATG